MIAEFLKKKASNCKGAAMIMANMPDNFWNDGVVDIDVINYPEVDAYGYVEQDDEDAAAKATTLYHQSMLCIKEAVLDYNANTGRLFRKITNGKQFTDVTTYVDRMSLFSPGIVVMI